MVFTVVVDGLSQAVMPYVWCTISIGRQVYGAWVHVWVHCLNTSIDLLTPVCSCFTLTRGLPHEDVCTSHEPC